MNSNGHQNEQTYRPTRYERRDTRYESYPLSSQWPQKLALFYQWTPGSQWTQVNRHSSMPGFLSSWFPPPDNRIIWSPSFCLLYSEFCILLFYSYVRYILYNIYNYKSSEFFLEWINKMKVYFYKRDNLSKCVFKTKGTQKC